MYWILLAVSAPQAMDVQNLASADAPSAACSVEITHTPVGAEVADYYPIAAFPQRLAGDAAIDCIADIHLKLTHCQVIAETPKGYGFGNATIKYFKKNAVAQPVDKNGISCIGRHVRANFHWQFS